MADGFAFCRVYIIFVIGSCWNWLTVDERFARIEHVTVGLAKDRSKDREEFRGLWRDTQRQLDQLTGRVDAIAAHLDTFITESAARDRETDRRFRETDARIDKMISAMGEFIRALSPPARQ